MRLILASTSPRRNELLTLLGLPFDVMAPSFAEEMRDDLPPDAQARAFAVGKARSCAARAPEELILGSDTLISIGNVILGKPSDVREAGAMLRRLRGQQHVIYTAVALVQPAGGLEEVALETVRVWMRDVDDAEIEQYVKTGEGLGKAGAYSIQGAGGRLIHRIDGDYTAAVGLPLRVVDRLLRNRQVVPPVNIDRLYDEKPFQNWAHFP